MVGKDSDFSKGVIPSGLRVEAIERELKDAEEFAGSIVTIWCFTVENDLTAGSRVGWDEATTANDKGRTGSRVSESCRNAVE